MKKFRRVLFLPKVVFFMYRRAYSEIEATYDEISKWMANNSYNPIGAVYVHYYNGPEFPESELLTMIVMPFA